MKYPIIQPIPAEEKYILCEDYPNLINGNLIRAPKGFKFDGASIPDILKSLFYGSYDPLIVTAALVHDWLYSNHQMSRKEADRVFRKILIRDNTDTTKTALMYSAVRLGGGSHYDHTELELEMLKELELVSDPAWLGHYKFPA